jgi:SAM-dependent methyltransferase
MLRDVNLLVTEVLVNSNAPGLTSFRQSLSVPLRNGVASSSIMPIFHTFSRDIFAFDSPASRYAMQSTIANPIQKNLWGDPDLSLTSDVSLVAAAYSLCAGSGVSLTESDLALWRSAGEPKFVGDVTLSFLASQVCQGLDPLGDAFCTIRSAELRRDMGATYTPFPIVDAMIGWAGSQERPERVIDPGCGSARFLIAAARQFPNAELVGLDLDPLASLIARANLGATGFAERARILLQDYRTFSERVSGRTLYIGNPPYVRHHRISPEWKEWLFAEAGRMGAAASKLAGLHVYFFLATALFGRSGDMGAFITAAEWLDVNYGSLMRRMLLDRLGGTSITLIDPAAQPFPDAATTAAITTFKIGERPPALFLGKVSSVSSLGSLGGGRPIHRERLEANARWSYLTHATVKSPEGYVELGELCRVHRGQVTGCNDIWIAGEHSEGLPTTVLYPTVTRAKELIAANGWLTDAAKLRRVIDIPVDLDSLEDSDRTSVDLFLKRVKARGANRGYVVSHRRAWWSVGLRAAAPIISTYMARRSPAFVINLAGARHINVAHGLYPREPLSAASLKNLVTFLQQNVSQRSGRTYAGGLTKFEPREMERLIVPAPSMLATGAL